MSTDLPFSSPAEEEPADDLAADNEEQHDEIDVVGEDPEVPQETVVMALSESLIVDDAGERIGLDIAAAISLDPAELTETLSELQTELAGTEKTGVPQVDAALEMLKSMDPTDLAGSAALLGSVLDRLEGVMQTPPEPDAEA